MELFRDLGWLLPPPEDFRSKVSGLDSREGLLGKTARQLASYRLSEGQLRTLSRKIDTLASEGRDLSPLTPVKLAVVGNGTLDLILPALTASAARHGVLLDCMSADFGQTMGEALNPDSEVNRFKPDVVLLCIDYRALPGLGAQPEPDKAAAFVTALRDGFRRHSGAVCIAPTFSPPVESPFGSYDRRVTRSPRAALEQVNRLVAASLADSGDLLFDVAALAETVGLAAWHSPQEWNLAKLPFAAEFIPLYADHVGRLLGALRGKSRRCLILDLDNTVWGGIIGDDGMDGIKLAQGDAVGEAFLDVQRMALMLRDRGVVLAVSSKNIDEVARAVFQSHPEMLLKEHHIAVFQANWNDKATNIRAIADALSLGLESMVFLDDNPVERGLVREILPEVAVPEVGTDPALYARTVMAAGYFETVSFSEEDTARAAFYQDNAKRATLQGQAGDVDAYLRSLDMEIIFSPFDDVGRSRIAQLISKSNQFNLTTRRYTEAEVGALQNDPAVLTLQVRLKDIFGDNGMICVVVCRPKDETTWEIDTWLMSCRVLGRGVERMVLQEVVLAARERGIERLIGVHIPTDRNGMVKDHYAGLGFAPYGSDAGGRSEWERSTAGDVAGAPMRVVRLAA